TATTGAKFYSIAGKNMEEGGNLTTVKSISLNEVEGELKAGVAYIFQATDATLTAIYSGNYASPVPAEDNNGLEGVFTEQNIDVSVTSQIYYVISGKNIYYVNSNVKVPAYRACIWMGSVPESSGAKADIEIINGDMPTAINGVNVEIAPTAVNYNIAGQKVNKNYKGVVISNGKKYVVK
ncbi:MAG: hypothetical protein Q4F34_02630, partial [Prevotellaceae bacterium]|nr:hypothetical protein [Prevotellaceae bacterium]